MREQTAYECDINYNHDLASALDALSRKKPTPTLVLLKIRMSDGGYEYSQHDYTDFHHTTILNWLKHYEGKLYSLDLRGNSLTDQQTTDILAALEGRPELETKVVDICDAKIGKITINYLQEHFKKDSVPLHFYISGIAEEYYEGKRQAAFDWSGPIRGPRASSAKALKEQQPDKPIKSIAELKATHQIDQPITPFEPHTQPVVCCTM